jgi:glyoxylase-like metal-dependent hydrolase (beta-lactamase superfamily II)
MHHKKMERRKFLGAFGAVTGLATNYKRLNSFPERTGWDQAGSTIKLKGNRDSLVTHWDVVSIGNLSRNRYWGDSDERPIYRVICTTTVISGKDFHLIVDPSLSGEKEMLTELKRRTGLIPDDINAVFITHQHGDHVAGLKHFQKARWIAGSKVSEGLNRSGQYNKKVEAATEKLFGAIDIVPTPGHTADHQSLRFDYKGMSVVIAGDAVATLDFWNERRAYYNATDPEESKRSMSMISSIADIIVPGHDNCFYNFG